MPKGNTLRTLLLLCLIWGCTAKPAPALEYPALDAPTQGAKTAPETAPPQPAEPPPPVAPAVQVTPGQNTPLPGPAPALRMRAPQAGQLLKGDKVEVQLELKDWPLSPDGHHVHLIVDNEPYMAIRDVRKKIDLRAQMLKDLGHDLAEGTHVLRTFPSRGHHESVKEEGAFEARAFHFKHKTDVAFDPKAPLLTYSRPKGCVDLGKPALLDFYLSNTTLSANGNRVRVTIDGKQIAELTSWVPYHIENLPEGEHSLRLELIDAQNNPIAGPFNDTTRSIRTQPNCTAAAAPVTATPTTPSAPNARRVPEAADPSAPVPTETAGPVSAPTK